MKKMEQKEIDRIKDIFQEKTGVRFQGRTRRLRPMFRAVAAAAILVLLVITAAAGSGLFSGLEGDELSLDSRYEGDGVVSIRIENRSSRDLELQQCVRLTRWTTGEALLTEQDPVRFDKTVIPAGTAETIRVDLSQACDTKLLEQPLGEGDWYYLTLTNHRFFFGQDWMCSVDFSEGRGQADSPRTQTKETPAVPKGLHQSLEHYFAVSSLDPVARRREEEAYVAAYTALLESFEGEMVSSVSPVLPGNRISTEMECLTVESEGAPLPTGINWSGRDNRFKLVARQGEYALVVSALLPDMSYPDAVHGVPVLYLLTYETDSADPDAYTFLYGRPISFGELEEYEVFRDERYVCYEVGELMFPDLAEYLNACAELEPNMASAPEDLAAVTAACEYLRENISDLIRYR